MKEIILSITFFLITIALMFFLLKLALSKLSYFKERKVVNNIVSILSAIIIYFFCSTIFFNSLTEISEKKFDEIIWNENINERHKMINDLLKSDYLVGKSRSRINRVFGKPERILEEGSVYEYKMVGRSWADFKIIDLKLYFENNTVKKFEYFKE